MDCTREIPGISKARRERIEQHIACGRGARSIALRIGCSIEDVVAVWCRMEEINDGEYRKRGPRPRERVSA